MGNQYSSAYFKCKGCGRKKTQIKIGTPKHRQYKCLICGTIVSKTNKLVKIGGGK